jgi:hypothetical protein
VLVRRYDGDKGDVNRACFYNDCMKYLGCDIVGVNKARPRNDCIKWGVLICGLGWKEGTLRAVL